MLVKGFNDISEGFKRKTYTGEHGNFPSFCLRVMHAHHEQEITGNARTWLMGPSDERSVELAR